ncbi:RNA methyltransferase, RsmD family [Neorickettsia helminthoeca str. Oregon]|uniref:RNA methyltransferase, RsmD family n=1 Tax=Neorickettsia helminthoeca str. Oregon TaxID=1286528 RepID=X5H368_9RICK|nr:16S rRNA (guanine(966)-N(2))-methyltransferase RsmD [Neorickettsia helminthoeca]AHX11148.1 RNA methyltransferase, RsmD family [Neorickettsia helminthoeca str. Oregon]
MRVISGKYREKKIDLIKGVTIRPTMGKVREALFNILAHSSLMSKAFEEIHFLDLFTGTGSISIEALSRGCRSITAVDIDTRCIRANLERLAISDITVLDRNIINLDSSLIQYDVVFMDPPYMKEAVKYRPATIVEKSFDNLHKHHWLASGSIVILEKDRKDNSEMNHQGFEVLDRRRYGTSELLIFRYKEMA